MFLHRHKTPQTSCSTSSHDETSVVHKHMNVNTPTPHRKVKSPNHNIFQMCQDCSRRTAPQRLYINIYMQVSAHSNTSWSPGLTWLWRLRGRPLLVTMAACGSTSAHCEGSARPQCGAVTDWIVTSHVCNWMLPQILELNF